MENSQILAVARLVLGLCVQQSREVMCLLVASRRGVWDRMFMFRTISIESHNKNPIAQHDDYGGQ